MVVDLSRFIFIDNHAHSLLRRNRELDVLAFRQCLSESRSLSLLQDHLGTSVFYLDLVAKLNDFLGLETEQDLIRFRSQQTAKNYVNMLFDDVSLGGLLVDDGYRASEMLTCDQLAQLCERPVYRVCRLEPLLEQAFDTSASFTEMSTAFEKMLNKACLEKAVAFKTIAAYRGGLEILPVSNAMARSDFDQQKSPGDTPIRMHASPLYHYFLQEAFAIAASVQMPVQMHVGLGDDDSDLRLANPAYLRHILHGQKFAKTTFVLLHCFPYVKEAACLCALYPNVYMDLSLSMIQASPLGDAMLMEALAVSPTSKILAGTDGHSIPEAHWYGVISWRRALSKALTQLVESGFINVEQAHQIAASILHDNARRLYNLEGLL